MNIVIPMAGNGSRFTNEGYDLPKPLIEVHNQTMIELVVQSLDIDGTYTFIVKKEHSEYFNLDGLLSNLGKSINIVVTSELTEGPACSVLLAKQYIDNDEPCIIANCDQVLRWSSSRFLEKIDKADGVILSYIDDDPKSSYITIQDGLVTRAVEKEVISNIATVGVYAFKKGRYFVEYAEKMINKNIRTNNEFYVSHVYNEMIEDGLKIIDHNIHGQVWLIGTPQDLDIYLDYINETSVV
jgi:NDP-sugar pyrophosphorylase family protein